MNFEKLFLKKLNNKNTKPKYIETYIINSNEINAKFLVVLSIRKGSLIQDKTIKLSHKPNETPNKN